MRTRNTTLSWAPWFCRTIRASAQLIDQTRAPNAEGDGIRKSYAEQIGAGRGDWSIAGLLVVHHCTRSVPCHPPRTSALQSQVQPKSRVSGQSWETAEATSTRSWSLAPAYRIAAPDVMACREAPQVLAASSLRGPTAETHRTCSVLGCAKCWATKSQPSCAPGATKPLRRPGPRQTRIVRPMTAKGLDYGEIAANPDGTVDLSKVDGVDPDLRVRPFFAHGGTFSIREFIVGHCKTRWECRP